MVYIIPNILVLHFGENFMKTEQKQQSYCCFKICIHNFMQIFMSFYEMQLKQQMLHTANFIYVFNPFKMVVQFFRLHQIFPILMIQILLFQIQQAPGPDFRKVGKSLVSDMHSEIPGNEWMWAIVR